MAYPNANDMYNICGTEYELGPTPSDGIAFDPIGLYLLLLLFFFFFFFLVLLALFVLLVLLFLIL